MNAPLFPARLRKPLPAGFIDSLQTIFGGRLSPADAVREHHGRDESPYPPMPPDAVIFRALDRRSGCADRVCARGIACR